MACKTIGRFVTSANPALAVAEGDSIPLNKSTVSNNCVSCNDGATITITAPGVYQVLGNFTFAATAAGNVETQLYRNGNAIPGAHAINTAAAAGDGVSQAMSAVITVPAASPYVTVSFRAEVATSVVIANAIVTKVA